MPQLGPMEVLVVAVIALIVFGPDKLPEIARNVARFMSQMRRMAADAREEFTAGLELDDKVEDEQPAAVVDENEGAGVARLHEDDEPEKQGEETKPPAGHPPAATPETKQRPRRTFRTGTEAGAADADSLDTEERKRAKWA